MADPVTASAFSVDGITASGVGILSALGVVGVYALKESLILFFAWLKKRNSAPDTAVGSSSGTHPTQTKPVATDSFTNRPMIEDHYFFITIDQLIKQRVPSLKCGGGVRTKMLQDMMVIYLETWKEFFTEFCTVEIGREGFESKNSGYTSSFSNRVATLLLDLQNEISNRWVARGIPLPAVLAFHAWDSKLVEILTAHSEKVAQSTFFPTNRERLVGLLTQHATFLATLLPEARYVLRRLNGGLDKEHYENVLIGPLDDPHDDPEPDHQPAPSDDDTPNPSGGTSKPRPKTPPGVGAALTGKKIRSGEWRESKKTPSEMRMRVVDPNGEQTHQQ